MKKFIFVTLMLVLTLAFLTAKTEIYADKGVVHLVAYNLDEKLLNGRTKVLYDTHAELVFDLLEKDTAILFKSDIPVKKGFLDVKIKTQKTEYEMEAFSFSSFILFKTNDGKFEEISQIFKNNDDIELIIPMQERKILIISLSYPGEIFKGAYSDMKAMVDDL